MADKAVIKAFEKAGLELKDGVYYGPARDMFGSRWEYAGIISGTAALTPDGHPLVIDDLSLAVLNDDDSLAVVLPTGETIVLDPGHFSEDLKLRFRNISKDVNAVYTMPRSDSELNDLFPLIYPDYHGKMYYDELRERERIDLSMLDPVTYTNGTFVDYTDQIEFIYYDSIERRLRMMGCKGNFPSVEVRRRVLSTKFYETRTNPFRDWLEKLVWDGKPRVDTWFKKVFNATAPPLEQYGLSDLYLAKVSRAWFCGAVARAYGPIVHEVVPVFIGGQGMGKTSGLRYSAGKDDWFIDTTADVSTPMGVREFLDTVRGRILVEMSEGSQLHTKDQERLKAFISKREDQYRKPYSRRDEVFPRHFILAASSNRDNVFTDLTGNRRYYPVYCHPSAFSERNDTDRAQVWAEAKHLYDLGEKSYVHSSWFPAMVMQEYATVDNANVSLIESYLDNPNNDNGMYTRIGAVFTKEELMFKVFGKTHVLANSPEERAWLNWLSGTRCWEKTEQPVKVAYSSVPQRAYIRIRSPIQNPYMHGSVTKEGKTELYQNCLDGAELAYPLNTEDTSLKIEPRFRGKAPMDIYKMLCAEQHIASANSKIDVDELSPDTLSLLMDNGFIFFDRIHNSYRMVVPLDD